MNFFFDNLQKILHYSTDREREEQDPDLSRDTLVYLLFLLFDG